MSAATNTQLRFEWPAGCSVFLLTEAEALKAAVALRGLGLGLTFRSGQHLTTTRTSRFTTAEALIKRDVRGQTLPHN